MSMLPLPAVAPAPRRTSRCRALRESGRLCGLVLVREPWVSLEVGPECAERVGLRPASPARLPAARSAADDLTLFDLEAPAVDLDAAPVALDLLRRQVAALLSQIDTATLPRPDHVRGRHTHPGPEWTPARGWRVFAIDTPDSAGAVYVDHDCDSPSLAYRFDGAGNWEALRIEDARRIGLAFLAAAEYAEQRFVGVSRLDDRRPEAAR
ncbi:hypothetical protein [Phytohabitans houttuyneae]|uniref:Uncharacterized protein n=1 Tax=Phytohabitans houttuyneae TaxID=1076126 RepID=A0A6V8K7L2_9ACTN|nr:hypothetical protein [Phytohabitans houttuyneae]GFJ79510.1 hypothetical protein Phou_036900 [Phytohabitans houttuyneae]